MLHIEYRKDDYKGCHIDLVPESNNEIPGLKDMLDKNFMIDNPAKTFSVIMRTGGYEGMDQTQVAHIAEAASVLSDLWENEPVENSMILLTRAMQTILYQKGANIAMDDWEMAHNSEDDWPDEDFFEDSNEDK